MEAYPYKQMSEKKFFPNVAPSPGSGPLLLAGAVAVQGVGGRGWRLPIGRELKIEASHWSRGPQEKNLSYFHLVRSSQCKNSGVTSE